jgi:hypothetical protein
MLALPERRRAKTEISTLPPPGPLRTEVSSSQETIMPILYEVDPQ